MADLLSTLPALTPAQWAMAIVGVLCIGISKSGFSGLGLVTVVVMARLFPPRESTGILLPLLICGDLLAVANFRLHASWPLIWKMLPPTLVGIVIGWLTMSHIPDAHFQAVIGCAILAMSLLQAARRWRPQWYEHTPHTRGFAWGMGLATGVVTMVANGAGPVMALYLMAIQLPKFAFVGTSAWLFLLINCIKVPFSWNLGLIHGSSLLFNLLLAPGVILGAFIGRWLIRIVPQATFELLLLIFTTLASLRLIFA